jgi:hypothetical protein
MTEKKITFADTFKVSEHEPEMNQLLLFIADLIVAEGKQEWADRCLVSDESQLRDFMPDAQRQKELEEKLGFPVSRRDYMAAIVAKMRQLGEQMSLTN